MKKCLSILLLLSVLAATVLAVIPAYAADTDELTNVALGCSYTGDAPYTLNADTIPGYREIDGKELTDGVRGGTSAFGTEWYALYNKSTYTITIDLGKQTADLNIFQAEFGNNPGSSIYLPKSVKFSVSKDNKTFVDIGTAVDRTTESDLYPILRLDAKQTESYRYVRMTMERNTGMFVFISEIEVYAGTVDSLSVESGNGYIEESDKTVRGYSEKTSVASFLSTLNSLDGVTLKTAAGKEKTSGVLVTGDILEKKTSSGVKTYTIIIDGDLDGDGAVKAKDYFMLKGSLLIGSKLSDAAKKAADVDGKAGLSARDYFAIKQHILGMAGLYTKYEPIPGKDAIMSYEIPKNFNDSYTDTFGVKEMKDLTVSLNSSGNDYTLTYRYADGATYTTHIVRKRWGMWMLGGMSYKPASGAAITFADSSTDYEWVLNCGRTASGITFRGGNHGDYTKSNWSADKSSDTNDHFIDMTFYDATTGERVDIAAGQTKTVKGLYVVVHNNIYDGEYEAANVMICVEKIYLFNAEQVFVESHLKLVQDVYFINSYTCMMPVAKKYGNNMKFYYDDGKTVKHVRTPLVGTSHFGSNFSNDHVASRVEMWGDNFPAYHMTVQIYNPEDQFAKSLHHTRLWDMAETSNKLYFSAFIDGKPTKVASGTNYTYKSSWTFSYQPNFVNPTTADIMLGF